MNMPLIAAASMAAGTAAGFFVCWIASKVQKGRHRPTRRAPAAEKKRIGVMDKVLVLEAVVLVAYTIADLIVFYHTGNEPATLTACVFGVCGLENGVMGWIKTNKDRAAEAARTSGNGHQTVREEPHRDRPEPPDVGI